ncbi:MAG: ParB/RepB/Spo0J family partition protein [Bacillota bacterium]|jgi:ParB family chromosome partitioning protein|nr:ParB/RepB/Spo0J family partition protein [Bacillota bacterium]HHT89886.1 ParB/RepB/Spo0J family partition protein [Bacillota bacterium]
MKWAEVLLNRKRTEAEANLAEAVQAVPIHLIASGKYQPRQSFDQEALDELAQSIQSHGLLQPVLLRKRANGYEVIVGERRLRACRDLGWETIPAIVRDVPDRETAELALIENLQRTDLHVFEVAEGYERLLTEFGLTQEELAGRLGVSQANVANKIRLLRLPVGVRQIISREMLSERHARALLRLENADQQLQVVQKVVQEGLSVRQTEELVSRVLEAKPISRDSAGVPRPPQWIPKDLRVFTNSVRELTATLKSAGLAVKVDQREDDQVYEIVVTVRKPHGGAENGQDYSSH